MQTNKDRHRSQQQICGYGSSQVEKQMIQLDSGSQFG